MSKSQIVTLAQFVRVANQRCVGTLINQNTEASPPFALTNQSFARLCVGRLTNESTEFPRFHCVGCSLSGWPIRSVGTLTNQSDEIPAFSLYGRSSSGWPIRIVDALTNHMIAIPNFHCVGAVCPDGQSGRACHIFEKVVDAHY